MIFKKVDKISDDVYRIIRSFENYSIYHSKPWHLFLNKTFNWDVNFVLGINDGKVCFILPYIEKKRYNLKKYTIALPFSHKVNIAFDLELSDYLAEFETKVTQNFSNFEIHDECISHVFNKISSNNITQIDLHQFKDIEHIYKSFDYKSIRYEINKFHKFNLLVKCDISDSAASDFYNLELTTRKRLGSPIYPKSFFKNLFSTLCVKDIFVKIVYHESKPIAGIIILKDNDTALYAYSASSDTMKSKKLHSTEYLIFEGIKWAYENNCRHFDFGTTPNHLTGLKNFKEKWGGVSSKINYSYFKINNNVDRTSFPAKMVSKILSHLPDKLFESFSQIIIKYVV